MNKSPYELKATIIYDGTCSFCGKGMEWVRQNALPETFEYLPSQSDIRIQRFPHITDEMCKGGMQLVLSDGKVFSGLDAIPEILKRLKRWRWVARLFAIHGIAWLSPIAYRWVAKHRYQISCLIKH